MSSNISSYVVLNAFEKALREMIVEEKTPELISAERSCPRQFRSRRRKAGESKKTIFNYIPCDNNFEASFAKFLDKAETCRRLQSYLNSLVFGSLHRYASQYTKLFPGFHCGFD